MSTSYATDKERLAELFRVLVEEWRRETGMHSSIAKKVAHPAYQKIIELGKPVLPLILKELAARPSFWFEALKSISGEDPVEPGSDVQRAATSWLEWGKEKGYA